MKEGILYKGYCQPLQDVDTKEGIVVGYFSSFGNIDSDGDVIQKGAYAKTISEYGPASSRPRIKHLLNHIKEQPVAKILKLEEDSHGLRYESKAGSHTLGQDWLKMCQDGIITEHSIGYKTIKSHKGKVEGSNVNFLTELLLREGSSMTFLGANEDTPIVGFKSLEEAVSVFDKLEKALRNGTYSDETFLVIEARFKELSELIGQYKTLNETTQPETKKSTTEPSVEQKAAEKKKAATVNQIFTAFKTAVQ